MVKMMVIYMARRMYQSNIECYDEYRYDGSAMIYDVEFLHILLQRDLNVRIL